MITVTLTQDQLANPKVALAFQNLLATLIPNIDPQESPDTFVKKKRKAHRLKVIEDNQHVEINPEIQTLFPQFKNAIRTLKTLELIHSNKVIALDTLQQEYNEVFPNAAKRSLEATLRIINYRLKDSTPFSTHIATTHGTKKTIFYWN